MSLSNCDYCGTEIDTVVDKHSYFSELSAVYCQICAADYIKRSEVKRDKENTYSDQESKKEES